MLVGGIAVLIGSFAMLCFGADGTSCLSAQPHCCTTVYRPAERSKVQGFNDLAVFMTMVSSSAASGAFLSVRGWADLNLYALPAVLIALAALIVLAARSAPAQPRAST